jgi:hypothetical protein
MCCKSSRGQQTLGSCSFIVVWLAQACAALCALLLRGSLGQETGCVLTMLGGYVSIHTAVSAPEVKTPRDEANHSLPATAEIKNGRSKSHFGRVE